MHYRYFVQSNAEIRSQQDQRAIIYFDRPRPPSPRIFTANIVATRALLHLRDIFTFAIRSRSLCFSLVSSILARGICFRRSRARATIVFSSHSRAQNMPCRGNDLSRNPTVVNRRCVTHVCTRARVFCYRLAFGISASLANRIPSLTDSSPLAPPRRRHDGGGEAVFPRPTPDIESGLSWK